MRNPYARLAVFTVAAAGVINVTNKVKRFIKNKMADMADLFKKS